MIQTYWPTNGFQQSQLIIIPLSHFHDLLGDFRLTKDDFTLSKPYPRNQPKGIQDIRLAQSTHYPNYSPGNQIAQIITIWNPDTQKTLSLSRYSN